MTAAAHLKAVQTLFLTTNHAELAALVRSSGGKVCQLDGESAPLIQQMTGVCARLWFSVPDDSDIDMDSSTYDTSTVDSVDCDSSDSESVAESDEPRITFDQLIAHGNIEDLAQLACNSTNELCSDAADEVEALLAIYPAGESSTTDFVHLAGTQCLLAVHSFSVPKCSLCVRVNLKQFPVIEVQLFAYTGDINRSAAEAVVARATGDAYEGGVTISMSLWELSEQLRHEITNSSIS